LLAADLHDVSFGMRRSVVRPPVVGAEVELIPVDADTRAVVPIVAAEGPSTLPLLRRFGAEHGWREEPSSYGVPRFVLPDGGTITYEPGGQIELSASPFPSVNLLVRSLRNVVVPLREMARGEGIDLLSVGIDPCNTVDDIPLQLPGKRYVALTAFMEAAGTGGTRMMRQTAAFQASLDWGPSPLDTWRLLNAAAPYVVAIFANSPVYRGEATGDRSFRARVWRELDGGRTGILPCGADPVDEYLRFALDAPVILRRAADGAHLPFAEWNARGEATLEDWHLHLTTLFPEIRPKGFVEVRSADAVAPEWYAAPLVLLVGATYHAPSFAEARELLGAPSADLLRAAGRDGLTDPRIASVASDFFQVALRGAAALGRFVSGEMVDEAREFFERYTRRGRSPADDVLDAFACAPTERETASASA
jgi:glutamate--cysteine ligase